MKNEYKTIRSFGTAELVEKKSRFIASAKPVSSEEEALEFISRMKSRYWDATHNVYAYFVVKDGSAIQRYSDDGEPAGTAGMPVLEIIKKLGVRDLVVVVTRYFGGTLLGAAGLVRAYGRAAQLAIEAAGLVMMRLCRSVTVTAEYSLLGKIRNLVASNGYAVEKVEYGQDIEMTVYVPIDMVEAFIKQIEEVSGAGALVEIHQSKYVPYESVSADS